MTQRHECGCDGVQIVTPIAAHNIPGKSSINFRVATHSAFLDSMVAGLTSHKFKNASNETERQKLLEAIRKLKTRDASDPSIAWLDCWATVADVLSFYQQYIANEGYLATATERRSVHELAKQVGYRLKPGLSANTYLAFSIDENQLAKDTSEIVISAGTAARTVGEEPQTFETSKDIIAKPDWNELKPRLSQLPDLQSNTINSVREITIKGLGHNLDPGDYVLFTFEKEADDSNNDTLDKWLRIRRCKTAIENEELQETTISFTTYFFSSTALADSVLPAARSLSSSIASSPLSKKYADFLDAGKSLIDACSNPEYKGLAALDGRIFEEVDTLRDGEERLSKGVPKFDGLVEKLGEARRKIHHAPDLSILLNSLVSELTVVLQGLTINDAATELNDFKEEVISTEYTAPVTDALLGKLTVDDDLSTKPPEVKQAVLRRLAPIFANLNLDLSDRESTEQKALEVLTCATVILGAIHDLKSETGDATLLAQTEKKIADKVSTFLGKSNLLATWQLYFFAVVNGEFSFSNRALRDKLSRSDFEDEVRDNLEVDNIDDWKETLRAMEWRFASYPFVHFLRLATDSGNETEDLEDAEILKQEFSNDNILKHLPEFRIPKDKTLFDWLKSEAASIGELPKTFRNGWHARIPTPVSVSPNLELNDYAKDILYLDDAEDNELVFWRKSINRTFMNECFADNSKNLESIFREGIDELIALLPTDVNDVGDYIDQPNFTKIRNEFHQTEPDLRKVAGPVDIEQSFTNILDGHSGRVLANEDPLGLLGQFIGEDEKGLEYVHSALESYRSRNITIVSDLRSTITSINTGRHAIVAHALVTVLSEIKKSRAVWATGTDRQKQLWNVLDKEYLPSEFLKQDETSTTLKVIKGRLKGVDNEEQSLIAKLEAVLNQEEPDAETKQEVSVVNARIADLINQLEKPPAPNRIVIGRAQDIDDVTSAHLGIAHSDDNRVATSENGSVNGAAEYLLRISAEQDGTFSDQMFDAIRDIQPVKPNYSAYIFKRKAFPFGHDAPIPVPGNPTAVPPIPGDDPDAIHENGDWKATKNEKTRTLFLDEQVDDISLNGYVIVEPNSAESEDNQNIPSAHQIEGRVILTRRDYNLVRKTTALAVKPDWWRAVENSAPSIQRLRETRVFVKSRRVDMVPAPVKTLGYSQESSFEQAKTQLQLAQIINGIRAGHQVVVEGELLAPDDSGAQLLKRTGITQTEVLRVALASQVFRNHHPGDVPLTRLKFSEPLKNIYLRDTVKIFANVAPATHGETKEESLGNGEGFLPGQKFKLSHRYISHLPAADSPQAQPEVETLVDNVYWDRVDQLSEHTSKDRVFVSRVNSESITTVQFGDGKNGAKLPDGDANIVAKYRTGLGAAGNAKANSITQLASQNVGLDKVFNPVMASGGANPESVRQSRITIPIAAAGLDRLVSLDDYRKYSLLYAAIEKVDVQIVPGNTLLVTIATNNDQPIDPKSLLNRNLLKALKENGASDFHIEIIHRRIVPVFIEAGVGIRRGYQWPLIEEVITEKVFERFDFENARFGQSIYQSDVASVIQNVEGVEYVDITKFGGLPGSPENPGENTKKLEKLRNQRKQNLSVVNVQRGRRVNALNIGAELALFTDRKENIILSEAAQS